jgi:ABC-type antimicrobial peptide transport system permease subunit
MDDIDDAIQPTVFEPLHSLPPRYFSVLVRTRGNPLDYSDGLQRAVAEIDPDTPAYWVQNYDSVLREATLGIRILANVFSGFGAVALALAAAGRYGVVAFAVARRTREIGVLRALGAPDSRVMATVASRSLWQIAIGMGLGVLLGMPLSELLASPIAHLASTEVSGWLPVLPLLAVIALLAVWIPARRALRVEPVVALRQE